MAIGKPTSDADHEDNESVRQLLRNGQEKGYSGYDTLNQAKKALVRAGIPEGDICEDIGGASWSGDRFTPASAGTKRLFLQSSGGEPPVYLTTSSYFETRLVPGIVDILEKRGYLKTEE